MQVVSACSGKLAARGVGSFAGNLARFAPRPLRFAHVPAICLDNPACSKSARLATKVRVALRLFYDSQEPATPWREDGVCELPERHADGEARGGVKRDSHGSVEELQLETRVMCSPGLEVELELAAPLALATSVGDDDLDHVIVGLVGNGAPAVEEVPEVGAEGWIGKSNTHGEESRLIKRIANR